MLYAKLIVIALAALTLALIGSVRYAESQSGTSAAGSNSSGLTQPQNLTALSSEVAVLHTTQGIIKIQFFPNAAPNHVKNFETLAKSGFYNGTIFHRIIPGFVIQGGDPNTKPGGTGRDQWGQGGPPYKINAEFNSIPHHRGIVSMARTADPNSAGSQFFIVLANSDFLDGQYTVFGEVTSGMDVVDKIAALTTSHDPATQDQPVNPEDARVRSVAIESSQVTPEFSTVLMVLLPTIIGIAIAIGRFGPSVAGLTRRFG